MTRNDKIAAVFAILFISVVCYYFLLPGRNWLGKPYLEPAHDGFAVVELFTSEGCSSCPSADDLMAKVQQESIGKKIYFLAYHVDYWDDLGWQDRFSSAQFTDRQQQYAVWMNRNLKYTPQFVVNGIKEFGGDDARTLYRLISNALQRTSATALTMAVDTGEDSLQVKYVTNHIQKDTSLFIALVQKNASTKVERGENTGFELDHVQIVQQAVIVALNEKDGDVILSKPENFDAKEWEVIGLVQNNSTGAISAAAKADFN